MSRYQADVRTVDTLLCIFIVYVRVQVYAQDIGSYFASRSLRTIDYELQRHVDHHNSKNTASATEVAWRGYWPFLLFTS